ncbi:DNA helicase [Tanacetum coccineum]
MCGSRGRFVLDFESSSVHLPSVEQDSGDCGMFVGGSTFGSSNVPRFLPDDRYDCLFRQSGSVETQGVSSLYMDIGDCQWSCEYCKAKFWYGERLKGYSKDHKIRYHKCCSGGKVVLEGEREPPEYIKHLLEDRHFMENIRAYNQMFSMTSFGARVDESINNGRGPYVFKISGQIYHWIGTLCPFDGDPPRRNTSVEVTRRGMDLDNSYTVPYNQQLCLTFHAHINVEYCGWSMLIKYLFKYISKGTDRVVAQITRPVGESSEPPDRSAIHVDEIQNFVITFRDRQPLQFITNNDEKKMTTLTKWLEFNKVNEIGRHLTYIDFPKEFVWYADSKTWQPRRRKGQGSIGRLVYVHPNSGELFYLRILLSHQKGCTSFEDIRTVNGRVYETFRAACDALGLLGDDKEWDIAMKEASFSSTASQLRSLFAQILIFCDVADPIKLWKTYWREIYSKSVTDFGLPPLSKRLLQQLRNREMMEEKSYDRDELAAEVLTLIPKLNEEQRKIYALIMDSISANRQELIFVYGHGGTRKTFLWKTIINSLRSYGKIILAVASSSIASLLLPAGRSLLAEADLIIWDESPMNDRRCFETLDRTLKDIMDRPDQLFGGKSVILGGDFRQTLPVKKGASKLEIVASSLAESQLWHHFKVCILRENMRLAQPGKSQEELSLTRAFAEWLLDIGNGNIGEPDTADPQNSSWVHIPKAFSIQDDENDISKLISFIYDEHTLQNPTTQELQQKAIVCPRNDTADSINLQILKQMAATMTLNCISDLAPGAKNKILEARGNAIQANMGKADIAYFSSLLQDGSAYRISKFTCVPTSNYQQNLENETTLRFGKYTSFENIPADTFPKHYFNFTSYNQLDTKMQRQDTMTTQKQPTLTDYIGSLIPVENVQTFGSAGSNLTIVRKLDIENLNGDIVELAIWDEMAKGFRKEEVDKMPKPVIFAVSSCKVSEYGGILQLLATSATHYYMNPEIPELQELHAQYNFKAFLSDQSATSTFTFFTPNGDVMTKHECSELVKKYNNPDPCDFPPEILSLKGHQHIFNPYNPYCEMGRIDFYFDDILDKPLQISGTDMPALKGTGMTAPGISSQLMIEASIETRGKALTTSPASTISDTSEIATPIEHITENPVTMSAPFSIDSSTLPGTLLPKSKEELYKPLLTIGRGQASHFTLFILKHIFSH